MSIGRLPIIFRVSLSFQDHTYIDRSFSVLVWVFEATPISISHLPIIPLSVCVQYESGRTYIDQSSSYQFGFEFLSWDRTYINRLFVVSIWVGDAPISISHCFVRLSWVLFDFKSPSLRVFDVQSHFSSVVSFKVTVLGIHIHWHCTSDIHGFALVLILLTLLPCAYRLFIIVLPDFPFHYTWRNPLSSRHIFRSCCWAPYA